MQMQMFCERERERHGHSFSTRTGSDCRRFLSLSLSSPTDSPYDFCKGLPHHQLPILSSHIHASLSLVAGSFQVHSQQETLVAGDLPLKLEE